MAIVAAVSLACGKPFVIVRKGEKGYGTDKAMEGRAEAGQRVVMVEDIVTSGGAALMAVDKLREAGLEVARCSAWSTARRAGASPSRPRASRFDPLFTATSLGIKKPVEAPRRAVAAAGVSGLEAVRPGGQAGPVLRGRFARCTSY